MTLQNILVEQLELCVEYLWKSERYELIAEVNKPIIAVFEKQRDFKVSGCLVWVFFNYPKATVKIKTFREKMCFL